MSALKRASDLSLDGGHGLSIQKRLDSSEKERHLRGAPESIAGCPPLDGNLISLHRVAVGVDLVDLAQVQLANTGLDFAHVSNDHPHQVIRQNILLGNLVRAVWR